MAICNYCGTQVQVQELGTDNNYPKYVHFLDLKLCKACGKTIQNEAVICPYCGVQIGKLNISGPIYRKDKSVAILLAFFVTYLATWIYTWEVDKIKFWIGLIVTFTGVGIIICYIWAIILAISRPNEFYANYPNSK